MHEVIVKRFNNTVPTHGITYVLGDVGICKSKEKMQALIARLNGTLVLVRGNHDKGFNAMYELGFDVVIDKAQIRLGDTILTMSHCPLVGVHREDTTGMRKHDGTENWHGEKWHHNNYSYPDFGQFHVHGHCHARGLKENGRLVIDNRQWDVGVCGNKFTPVTLSQIESWIHRYKKEHSSDNN
tara:strand:- start:2555 stop:3103 length:549 start_codon:yes stop_codon:yes gene_type:complete